MDGIAHTALEPMARAVADRAHPAPGAAMPITRAVRSAKLQLLIITSVAGLASLESEWNDLFDRAGSAAHVFQTHGFVELFARTHGYAATPGDADHCRCQLAVVTAHRGGRMVLAWPLVTQRQLGLRVLSWLGEPVAQYGDVLADPQEDVPALLAAAYLHIRAVLDPHVLRLRKVRADATIAPFLASLSIAPGNIVEAPCVTLAAGGSSFEDRQSGKARKNRRRLHRRLEEQGTVTFCEATAAETQALIATGLADKRAWLVRRGLLSPALADHRLDAFMTAATGPARRTIGATVFALRFDGRPIAFAFGFRCKQRLMLHLITYAADFEKSGAGVLNLEAILRLAEAEGLEAVDLLPPKAEYKLDWADTCVLTGDHVWGLNASGRLSAALLETQLRPTAKQALEALPLAVRQKLASRALKTALPSA